MNGVDDSGRGLCLLLLDHSFLGLGPRRGGARTRVRRKSEDLALELTDPAVGVGVVGLQLSDSGDENFSLPPEGVDLKFELFSNLESSQKM